VQYYTFEGTLDANDVLLFCRLSCRVICTTGATRENRRR